MLLLRKLSAIAIACLPSIMPITADAVDTTNPPQTKAAAVDEHGFLSHSSNPQTNYQPDKIIVKFKSNLAQTAFSVSGLANIAPIRRVKPLDAVGVSILELANGQSVPDTINKFKASGLVDYAEPDYRVHIDSPIPSDPEFNKLWGLHNTGQTYGKIDADIDALEAWTVTTGDTNTVVAVIDTGVDYNHPDLAANIWTNPGEIAGNGIDDDDNGYVDDIHGIDADNNDSDPMDDHGHGTHCAGTIGAVGNNGVGVAGVNWRTQIMPLKFLNASGSGNVSDAVTLLNYTLKMKQNYGINLKVTSNSWGGGGYSQALKDAIDANGAAGILFIAAAGNDAKNNDFAAHYPSAYDSANIISVAATDHNDNLAGFSNYGVNNVDLAAPGADVYSTLMGGGFGSKSGTSMATPHVAGSATLLWSKYPTYSLAQIQSRLINTVDVLASLENKVASSGRLNLNAALRGCSVTPVIIAPNIYDGFLAKQGSPQTVTVSLSQCKQALLGATIQIITDTGTLKLLDNGIAPDQKANDGIYSGIWTPVNLGNTTLTVTANYAGKTYQKAVTGSVTTEGSLLKDPIAKECIRKALGMTDKADPTKEQLASLTQLTCYSYSISDSSITDLGKLTNLQSLNFSSANNLKDISALSNLTQLTALSIDGTDFGSSLTDITPLANLTNLTSLSLQREGTITDISPLAGLTNLKTLSLYQNQVMDISPLAGLSNLATLILSYNKVQNVSPLASLNKLNTLHLWTNQISDISALNNLKEMQTLDIGNNLISNISTLGILTKLSYLDLSYNKISNIAALTNLTNLTGMHLEYNQITDLSPIKKMTALNWLRIADNNITDISPLANLTKLTYLGMWDNQIKDIQPVSNLTELTWLSLWNNQIVDISPLARLTKLTSVRLNNNLISDVSPLANLSAINTEVNLASNQITDISPLANMKNTFMLYLEDNCIGNAAVLPKNITVSLGTQKPSDQCKALDTTPDKFTFTDQLNVPLSTQRTSNTITVTGINTPTSIRISNGQYSINGGAYSSAEGLVNNGNTVTVRHTSSTKQGTRVDTALTIGGVADTFSSTTLYGNDTQPNAFHFTDQTNVARSSLITSNALSISGINAPTPISITNGKYSINGSAYTSAAGTILSGDNVQVQHTSATNFASKTNTLLNIGGITDTFTTTTEALDNTPDPFSFTAKTGVEPNTLIESDIITVKGLNTTVAIRVSSTGKYRINGGSYTNVQGTVKNGDTVQVVHTSSTQPMKIVETLLTLGSSSGKFTSTTKAKLQDANALACIRAALNLSQDQQPTQAQIESITSLYCENNLLMTNASMKDLGQVVNLTSLVFTQNRTALNDISGLGTLTKLEDLRTFVPQNYLGNGRIANISALANMPNLSQLDLSINSIADLSPLRNASKLRYLGLSANKVSNLTALANLSELSYLMLNGNKITDITPISNLPKLVYVTLGGNTIKALPSMKNLIKLESLYIGFNQIKDISSIADLQNIVSIDLMANFVADVSPLAKMTNTFTLELSGNCVTDASMLPSNIKVNLGTQRAPSECQP